MGTVSRKEALRVRAWEKFCEKECGVYPPKLAAAELGMTTQGVRSASDAGWISYFLVGRERFYSRRDVSRYRHNPRRPGCPNTLPPPHLGTANKTREMIDSL
ncbi:hypothetical protein HNR46_000102 [Haloferula luteola]|uniref:Helix-turn-helix domain-containing protein n=1 Tax=Haloferula luteola TaxID=595692 RepID=A0A840VAE3_9BACT|nr:hypothetical protein [Haloferula luteola]